MPPVFYATKHDCTNYCLKYCGPERRATEPETHSKPNEKPDTAQCETTLERREFLNPLLESLIPNQQGVFSHITVQVEDGTDDDDS